MDIKKLLWLIGVVIVAVAAVWIIFGEHEGEMEASIPDEIQYPNGIPYTNKQMGFGVTIPTGFIVDDVYKYKALGPGKEIPGIAFRIPVGSTTDTNLSSDTYVSVEKLAGVACTPKDFLSDAQTTSKATIGSNSYEMAKGGGAAAGNLYEETVYVKKNGPDCYAVRYFVHSTNIGNYDPGSVRQFDRDALLASFERIASSLTFN